MNYVQAGFRKGRGTRDQIANIHWIFEKAREFQTNIYFCFIDYAKAFDCVDHNKLWKILKEMGIPDHLTCILRMTVYIWTSPLEHAKAGFRKGRGTSDQIANIRWIIEKAREFQKNIYFCFIDYDKAFDCVDHNKLWKIWKRWEYQTTWPASWETYMQVRKQQLEQDMEQQTGSK